MKRLTEIQDHQYHYKNIEINDQSGAVLEKLGILEDIIEECLQKQQTLEHKLDNLRQEHKVRSMQFQQLLGEKMINQRFLTMLELKGISLKEE